MPASGTVAVLTRRRARLASCRAAAGERPAIGAISSKAHVEHVVQHEREPLRRRKCLEHHKQRETDRVGQEGRLLRVRVVLPCHDRIGEMGFERFLAARPARTQHVEAHAGRDRRQPAAQILDLAAIGSVEPQPRLLHRVIRLAQRAEHPVGDRPQARPVRFESCSQPLGVHCHIPRL